MSVSQVLLVALSGLGVLHGILLAFFLWKYPKGLRHSNKLLSLLLLVLSFRIGKSVLLEFAENIYIQLIFLGLATLLMIGPLFYLYTKSVLEKTLTTAVRAWLHFVPAALAMLLGFLINKQIVSKIPDPVFIGMFCLYYGHYLIYLLYSYRLIRLKRDNTEEHKAAVQWLFLLLGALAALWIVYVLNLLEETIPYVLGPVLYSIIAYSMTYLAIKRGYIGQLGNVKYKTTPLSASETEEIFERLKKLLMEDKLYTDPNLTLSILAKKLKVSPQKISMAVNVKSGSNLNIFINQYRIKQAIVMMQQVHYKDYSITAIAFEVGFNSLTSFNTSFKKETSQTPSAFRKELSNKVISIP